MRRPIVICLLILISFSATNLRADERAPVPKSLPQSKALQKIRTQFKDEYARKDASIRVELSRRLREEAGKTTDDLPRQYVLLREARELAIDAGDFDAAFAAIEDMAKTFQVDTRESKVSALTAAVDKAAIPPAQLSARYLQVADGALNDGNLDLGNQAAMLAHRVAFASHDGSMMKQAREMDARVREGRKQLYLASAAWKKFQANPDDAEAALTVGRFLCLVIGQWDKGLPALTKCSDSTLRELAQKDLAAPVDPKSMADLADLWWDLPEEKQTPRRRSRDRAAYWYEKALPGLATDRKAQAEQRIAQVKATTATAR
jgi:hypothetical protein